MGILNARQVPSFQRPRETVDVPELGAGAQVIVQGISLSSRLELDMLLSRLADVGPAPIVEEGATPKDVDLWGERRRRARETAVAALVPETLARCVVDADGAPLMSADEWEAFGQSPKTAAAALRLLGVARKLNGQDLDEAAKN